MIERILRIGRWEVDFLFCVDNYDEDIILSRLVASDAPEFVLDDALYLIDNCQANCGFTYTNPVTREMVVMIGPTTSGAEFVDTLTHEVHHVAVSIADSLGIDLDGENPAYNSGDAMRELTDVVCHLGCSLCN